MESIHSFSPNTSQLDWTSMLAALVAFVCLGLIVFYTTKKVPHSQRKQKQLISLFIYFAFLISLGTAILSWIASKKIDTVHIFADRIDTPYGAANFNDISNVHIYMDKQNSRYSKDITLDTTRMLVIEEYNGKTHVLTEDNYPIDKISAILEQLLNVEEK